MKRKKKRIRKKDVLSRFIGYTPISAEFFFTCETIDPQPQLSRLIVSIKHSTNFCKFGTINGLFSIFRSGAGLSLVTHTWFSTNSSPPRVNHLCLLNDQHHFYLPFPHFSIDAFGLFLFFVMTLLVVKCWWYELMWLIDQTHAFRQLWSVPSAQFK